MVDAEQIELLGRSKRRAVLVLCLTAVALLVVVVDTKTVHE